MKNVNIPACINCRHHKQAHEHMAMGFENWCLIAPKRRDGNAVYGYRLLGGLCKTERKEGECGPTGTLFEQRRLSFLERIFGKI